MRPMNPPRSFHCTACGAAHTDVEWPKACPSCAAVAYRNPTPVAVVLLPVRTAKGLALLTIRRAIEPQLGALALPGGYVDHSETWQEGAARELFEETGMKVEAEAIAPLGVHSPPGGRVVLIFGEAPAIDESALAEFKASPETSEFALIHEGRELAFPLHTQVAGSWFAGGPRAAHVDHVLRTRRTVHLFTSDPVPKGAIDAALAAAIQAPNHRHTHPWRFTVVGQETRTTLAEIGVRLKTAKAGKELSPEVAAKVRAKVTTAAELVVFRQVLHEDPAVREEDYASLACAAQNLMLSLHARGIYTKWGSGGVTRHDDTYALLGVDREIERIVGFLYCGYAAAVPSPKRPPLAELVTRIP
jgi:nitroreductase/predicted NUDIX family NTP pyrophosphohydrolase